MFIMFLSIFNNLQYYRKARNQALTKVFGDKAKIDPSVRLGTSTECDVVIKKASSFTRDSNFLNLEVYTKFALSRSK